MPITLDTFRKVGLTFPGVEADTAYGSPALKVDGKLLACVAINKSAEPGSIMFRVDQEARNELIAEAPDIYYITDHYEPYPSVLVRMSKINTEVLRDLLGMAHKFVTRTPNRKPAKRRS